MLSGRPLSLQAPLDSDKTCGPGTRSYSVPNTALSFQTLIRSASLVLHGRVHPRGQVGRTEDVRAGGPSWPRPAPSPEPGHQRPLCAVSLASAPLTVSPHSMLSDHVIVFQVTYLIFSPTFPGKQILFA